MASYCLNHRKSLVITLLILQGRVNKVWTVFPGRKDCIFQKKKGRVGAMAGEKQSVVIAEDEPILREGLRALISSNPNFDVVAEAGTEEYRAATLLHLSWITSPSQRV
jgi:hypothetical protein